MSRRLKTDRLNTQAYRSRLSTNGCAQIHAWGARSLFIGPSFNLSAHRNAVAVLAVGVENTFVVADDPRRPEAGGRACRTALIPPNTLHHLDCGTGCMTFLYVDAVSRDFERLAGFVRSPTRRAGFDLSCEIELIDILSALAQRRTTFAEARRRLQQGVLGESNGAMDPRVARSVAHLHDHASERPSLADLAKLTGLSPSRFRHVFKDAIGVTLRRYRIWLAFGVAMRCLARGQTLTETAHEAGFSSSAHFSSAFREMFGVEPSRVMKSHALGVMRVRLPDRR